MQRNKQLAFAELATTYIRHLLATDRCSPDGISAMPLRGRRSRDKGDGSSRTGSPRKLDRFSVIKTTCRRQAYSTMSQVTGENILQFELYPTLA